jgi:hypothetical protein
MQRGGAAAQGLFFAEQRRTSKRHRSGTFPARGEWALLRRCQRGTQMPARWTLGL